MSDTLLRSRLIRLASANPSLRKDILPLLKGGSVPTSKNAGSSPPDDPYALLALNALMASSGNDPSPVFTKSNMGGFDVRVPDECASLFAKITLVVGWQTNDPDGFSTGFVNWELVFSTGKGNRNMQWAIGYVRSDPKTGQWGWTRADTGERGVVGRPR